MVTYAVNLRRTTNDPRALIAFYQVLGHGFDFHTYRERVLRDVKQRYYRIPGFLPMNGCYFCERYFPDEECR